ncbi:hypothetical protein PM082_004691 [Marasmius tenuissimus]|nr:hypothetical protein PM082_004691 [Marasmius tenuissimus]
MTSGGVVTINRTLYTSAFVDISFSGSPISCSSPEGVCEELLKRCTWAPLIRRNGVGEQRKFLLDVSLAFLYSQCFPHDGQLPTHPD